MKAYRVTGFVVTSQTVNDEDKEALFFHNMLWTSFTCH